MSSRQKPLRPGDKIRIVAPWSHYEPYSVGDVLYVDSLVEESLFGRTVYGVYVRGLHAGKHYIAESEYEVI